MQNGGMSEMSEKEIDANLEETFPASDPPSWTLGVDDHKGGASKREDDADSSSHDPPRDGGDDDT